MLRGPTGTNWINSILEPVATRQDLIRGDVVINSKMNLMVRYINETWDRENAAGNFWGNTPFPTLSFGLESAQQEFRCQTDEHDHLDPRE